MNLSQQIAKNFREVWFGGNWTASNFKDQLKDVTLPVALQKNGDLNTIATLLFHSIYYVHGVNVVFDGGDLTIHDKFSFTHPEFRDEDHWQAYLKETFAAAETFAQHVEKLPPDIWLQDFIDGKYGNYYRNIAGIIEHSHYHLGQLVLLKKGIGGS